jgi:hypothetical protein
MNNNYVEVSKEKAMQMIAQLTETNDHTYAAIVECCFIVQLDEKENAINKLVELDRRHSELGYLTRADSEERSTLIKNAQIDMNVESITIPEKIYQELI